MKKLNISIKRSAFLILLLTATFSIFSISALWIWTEIKDSKGTLVEYKEAYENEQKEYLKNEVKRVVEIINFTRKFNKDSGIEDVKNNILSHVTRIRLKYGGYIFINTYDGKALVFDGVKIIGEKDISNMTDPEGLRLFDIEMRCAKSPDGDFFKYKFKRLDSFTPVPKLSYALGYHDWEWIIGAGIYLDDVGIYFQNQKNLHQAYLFKKVLFIILLFVVLLLIFFAVSNYLAWFINREFEVFTSFFGKIELEDTTIDQKDLKIDEFKKLGHSVNTMIKQRRAFEKLIKSEGNKANNYLKVAAVIILALDKKGNVTLINKKGCDTLGYKEEDIIGKNWFNHFLPISEKKKIYIEFLNVIKKDNNTFKNKENKIICKSGTERYIAWQNTLIYDDDENIVGTLSSGLDITEKKIVEASFFESEEKYKQLFDNTGDPVFIIGENNTFEDCNNAAVEILEYENKKELTNIIPDDISPKFQPNGELSSELSISLINAAREKGYQRFEWQHVTKNNKPVFVDISLTRIPMSGVNYLYVVWRNITEKKKQQEELIIAKEKAEQSDSIKTSFLHNMQHEIRTPLNAILGFTQLLKQQSYNKTERDEYYGDILNSGNQLTKIIDKIIDFARLQSGYVFISKNKLELKKLISEIFIEYYPGINHEKIKFQISSNSSNAISYVITDDKKVREIIGHLLDNAIKFTESGKIELSYTISNDKIIFSVADTGIGIQKKHFTSIFGRFNQLTRKHAEKLYGGNGLGLSISKAVLKYMGGKIWVDSKPGEGSIFNFSIPYIPVDNEIITKKMKLNDMLFVIVTNNMSKYEQISKLINSNGAQTMHLKTGFEAIEYFQKNWVANLLIVDNKLKDMNGVTTCKAIKAFKRELPIIVLADEHCKEDALLAGCSSYLLDSDTDNEILTTLAFNLS